MNANDNDDVFFAAAAVYPTAGYLFADELDMQCSALDELHAMLLQEPTERPFASSWCPLSTAVVECVSPTSPSSVTHLRPCGDSDDTFRLPKHMGDIDLSGGRPSTWTNYNSAGIKPEVAAAAAATTTTTATTVTTTTLRPTCLSEVPLPADAHEAVETSDDEDRERLRRRQRGYEKRYRGRKRVSRSSDCYISIYISEPTCSRCTVEALNLIAPPKRTVWKPASGQFS